MKGWRQKAIEPPKNRYVVGKWTVEVDRRQLRCGDRIRRLEPITLRLLIVLIENRGRLTSSDELLREVWEGRFIDSKTIAKRVSELRQALGDQADGPKYIATVPRRGYVLIAAVRSSETTRGPGLAAAAVVLLGSALLFWGVFTGGPPVRSTEELVARAEAALSLRARPGPSPATVELLEQAVASAPALAEARVALIEAYALGALSSGPKAGWRSRASYQAATIRLRNPVSPREQSALGLASAASFHLDDAMVAQERARLQDRSDTNVAFRLAEVRGHRGQWLEALSILLGIFEEDPTEGLAAFEVSRLLRDLGLTATADAWFRLGERLNPLSIRGQVQRATFDLSVGQYAAGRRRMIRLMEVDAACIPCLQILAEIELREEGAREAGELLRLVVREAPDPARALARLRLATLSRDRAAGLAALAGEWRSGLSPGDDSWFGPWLLTRLHAASGRTNEALRQHRLAIDRGYRDWRMDESEPLFAELGKLPQFQASVRWQRSEIARMRERALELGLAREPDAVKSR